MEKERIKIKIELIVALGIVLGVTSLAFWSAWFGEYNSQTGFDRVGTIINRSVLKKITTAEIIFLGDSITAYQDWGKLFDVQNIANAGISGGTTDDVLAKLDPLVGLKPKKIFIMIGVNDLAKGKEVSYILDNYKTIIERIRAGSPETAIYIESILPVDNNLSSIGEVDGQKIIELNKDLELLARQEGENFINLYPTFVVSGGRMDLRYAKDGVHLNVRGYAVWKNLIARYIE